MSALAGGEMVEMELTFRSVSDGGRVIPNGIFQNFRYRPHIVIGQPDQKAVIVSDGNRITEIYLGVAFSNGPEHVEPSIPVITEAALIYWPNVDYSNVVSGATFTLREGGHIVGHGCIIKRWNQGFEETDQSRS